MLIITGIWAVGMHHWGGRSLNVGSGYRIEMDENNPKDPYAVCIKEDGKIKAYIKKEDVFTINKIMRMGLSNFWLLKPKEDPVVKSRRVGPQQKCNIGCRCSEEKMSAAIAYLKTVSFSYIVKD